MVAMVRGPAADHHLGRHRQHWLVSLYASTFAMTFHPPPLPPTVGIGINRALTERDHLFHPKPDTIKTQAHYETVNLIKRVQANYRRKIKC